MTVMFKLGRPNKSALSSNGGISMYLDVTSEKDHIPIISFLMAPKKSYVTIIVRCSETTALTQSLVLYLCASPSSSR